LARCCSGASRRPARAPNWPAPAPPPGAWRLARAAAQDLILIDADLPDGDGDGVALAESLGDAYPRTRIAICSGRHGVQEGHAGRLTRIAFLTKPVPEHRLAALLAVALDGNDQAGDTSGLVQE
jgi:DNA-binding NarL/FixJ family response regulator